MFELFILSIYLYITINKYMCQYISYFYSYCVTRSHNKVTILPYHTMHHEKVEVYSTISDKEHIKPFFQHIHY